MPTDGPSPVVEQHLSREFALFSGVQALPAAHPVADATVRRMVRSDELLQTELCARPQLLEESWLPPPGGESTPFLALHFDWGHPLFPTPTNTVYLFVVLYMPSDRGPSTAATRVVSLESLLAQRNWGHRDAIEERLRNYAQSHGSGWDWDGDSGHRVSCFARILDALNPPHRLTNYRTTPREHWYAASRAGHEFDELADEEEFYRLCGAPLDAVERRVVLQPGDLLVLNNVRTIHGRIGCRGSQEVYQWLYGVRDVPDGRAVAVRRWLVGVLSDSYGHGVKPDR